MSLRWFYLGAAAGLFFMEAAIAVFVGGGFVRHTIGDVLVVMLLYCGLMGVTQATPLPAASLAFAVALCVEIAQALDALERLGLGDNTAARTVFGATFSWSDIAAYLAGALFCLLTEAAAAKRRSR